MPTTISFTAYDDAITLAEINSFFASVATAINGKLDRDGGTLGADLNVGAQLILNLPYATEDDEPVPLKQFQELASG